jgi:hypothetical protein
VFWVSKTKLLLHSTFSLHGPARSLQQCLIELAHSTTAPKQFLLLEEGLARPVALVANDLAVILRTIEVYNPSG